MHHTLPRARFITFLILSILCVSLLHVLLSPAPVRSIGGNVVISEVQITGPGSANNEFVELYNPSDTTVDLTGWRLSRRSASATAAASILVSSLSGTINPYSYYLIAHPSASASGISDRLYSATGSGIAVNNTVRLYSDNGITLIDKVGIGTAGDVETSAFSTNPGSGESIERKACVTSTAQTLLGGGSDEFSGNALDTNNNSTDFVLQNVSHPQNSQSAPEVPLCGSAPTPSPSPTATPDPTVEPTATPEPTPSPSPTPTPTVVPTPSPTPTPAPTPTPDPTIIPSPTPEITPSPTPSVTPSPSPTTQPTNTPKPNNEHHHRFPKLVCKTTYHWVWFRRWKVRVPQVTCEWRYVKHFSFSHWNHRDRWDDDDED
jgi:hypothetical protein